MLLPLQLCALFAFLLACTALLLIPVLWALFAVLFACAALLLIPVLWALFAVLFACTGHHRARGRWLHHAGA
eukprot:453634-Pelagomonas_calceolata.AAC.5